MKPDPESRLAFIALLAVTLACGMQVGMVRAADAAYEARAAQIHEVIVKYSYAESAAGTAAGQQHWPDMVKYRRNFDDRTRADCGEKFGYTGGDFMRWLPEHPAATECYVKAMQTRIAALDELAVAARAGSLPDEAFKAVAVEPLPVQPAKSSPAAATSAQRPVDPLSGGGAAITHSSGGATLTYTDAGGGRHSYAVARPKFAQQMMSGDLGGWVYVAPDRKSGVMFNIDGSGRAIGKPLNPMMLQMMAGQ